MVLDNGVANSDGEEAPMKYILVTGGVISGVGKGIISSSIGVLLKNNGYKVSAIKIDPYLNIDAGTFSPYEHGEVFVLDDGGEVDLDLGNYERFLNVRLTRDNNITTGKMFQHVTERERRGDYCGKTVQMIPHFTDAIIQWVERVARIPVDGTLERPDVCIIEADQPLYILRDAILSLPLDMRHNRHDIFASSKPVAHLILVSELLIHPEPPRCTDSGDVHEMSRNGL
ncbi:hypothetical protein Y032_0182g890 [Ancylostoma ceylanicum]|uniref:CTP synthase N-terminal domain-containing protein n=1 Tax=Ancylostoma ceylanicum TaxID=53326 RepID=A0A016SSA9_9BILA|nr:hypothetical protein Y032_0182g890 [Ancylostoma ceylanicum]